VDETGEEVITKTADPITISSCANFLDAWLANNIITESPEGVTSDEVMKENFEIYKPLLEKMSCFNSTDFTLKGQFYSKDFKYVKAELRPCDPSKRSCASASKVDEFLSTHSMNLLYLDSYLDPEDFLTPIKNRINMPYYSYLTAGQ